MSDIRITYLEAAIPGPVPWLALAAWAPSTAYVVGPPASVVTYDGETYVCTTAHTSGGAFDGSKWQKVVEKNPLSSTNPAALGAAAPGVSSEAARGDHVHPMPTATDVGADPAGTAAAAVSAHLAASDPHPVYTTAAEAAAAAPVQSVAGRTGNVTLGSGDVSGLGNSATRNVGTTGGTVAAGDDPRFSDARTPTAHVSSHAAGGADPLTRTILNPILGGVYEIATAGTYDDVDTSDANFIRANSGTGTITLNGILAPASGSRQVVVWNAGSTGTVVLNNEAAGSAAANRFTIQRTTITIAPGRVARLTYRPSSSRWAVDYQDWVQVDVYGTPGLYTWNKPANVRLVRVLLVGGGGGGGSGAKGPSGQNRTGGSGGGAGALNVYELDASLLPLSSYSVRVGAAGSGGAAQTVNGSSGNNGTNGGTSWFAFTTVQSFRGSSGIGGVVGGTSVAGGSNSGGQFFAGQGGSGTQIAGGNAGGNAITAPTSGGGGGGLDTSNTARNGGTSAVSNAGFDDRPAAGVAPGGSGGNGISYAPIYYFATGGAGGASSSTGNGGNGGNGGNYGAGGGGGGATQDDVGNSGSGGNGGSGLVVVMSFF